MSPEDLDHVAWVAMRADGRRAFVERRIAGFGLRLGLVLAAWNTAVGGTFGNYDRVRLVLEATFYLTASLACGALSAVLEWDCLRRKFER